MHLSRARSCRSGAAALLPFAVALCMGNLPRPAAAEERPSSAELRRTSTIITAVTIPLTAVRDKLDKVLPEALVVRRDTPSTQPAADTDWKIVRDRLTVSGLGDDGLTVAAALNGTFRTTGQPAGAGVSEPSSGDRKQGAEAPAGIAPDLRAELRGDLTVTSRPILLPQWRIEPRLVAQVSVTKSSIVILGNEINLSNEVRPLIDKTVQEQVAALEKQIRDDSLLETRAREEWDKMCGAIPLEAAAAGMPKLWLEVRPMSAMGAQPRVDGSSVVLTIGVRAETRVVPTETKPECPFPDQIQLVPQVERGPVHIALPIDAPIEEVNRLLEAKLVGRTFPEGKGNAVVATVRTVRLTSTRDHLNITLGIRAKERKTWFGLGASGVAHARGRPVLDAGRQLLRFDDVSLKVDAQGAMLGAVARAVSPYLENALAEHALIDLKPIAAAAGRRLSAALAASRGSIDGMEVDATMTSLRLVGLGFDTKGLRLQAEADGLVRIKLTELP
ncbi:MAG: DUF4403 family protein [Hyphomicrobiales bacterium]|nr:DUF4403 family protein [Hyphomicrobiales bacterium]